MGENNFGIDFDGNEQRIYCLADDGTNNVGTFDYDGYGWVYLCLTFDGSQLNPANRLKLYLNGSLVILSSSTPGNMPATLPTAASLGFPSIGFGFGGDGPNGSYYAGIYDDLQVFDTTLLLPQVQAIYEAGAQ
jgi:hypothetical protein